MKTTLVVAVLALAFASTAVGASYSTRTLSDGHLGTQLSELTAQEQYSQQTLAFLNHHRWMIAARHANCWSHVPWAKTCNHARRLRALHEELYASAHARIGELYPDEVIREVWGPGAEYAISVFRCESHLHTWATNGQYYGIAQMGSHERSLYGGSSSDAWEQVEAAHTYYLLSGWRPWSCAG